MLLTSLREPPIMAVEKLFPGGEIRSIVRMTEYEKIYQFPRFYVSTSKSIIKALINMRSFEIQLSPIG